MNIGSVPNKTRLAVPEAETPPNNALLRRGSLNARPAASIIQYIGRMPYNLSPEPLSDTHRSIVRHFEDELWKYFGLPGVLVPDELLKECQKRLYQATRNETTILGPEDVAYLTETLEILDKIHQERKAFPVNIIQAAPTRWNRRFGKALPPTRFRQHNRPDFGNRFWALIIGNDAYPKCPLRGCINDTLLVQEYLKEYLGVPPNHIRLLHNATRHTMINSLYDLRDDKNIENGDNILIHFSGHGTSYDPDEYFTDVVMRVGSIEGICPVDRGPSIPDISDRELNAILYELKTEKGENITLFSDCCHSGGMVRSYDSDPDDARRYISPLRTVINDDDNEPMPNMQAMFQAADNHPRRSPDTPLTSCDFWMGDIEGFVQLAGCQDFQVAMEGMFSLAPVSKAKIPDPRELHRQTFNKCTELDMSDDNCKEDQKVAIVQGTSRTNSDERDISISAPLGKAYGSFTWALVKVLKSQVGKTGTYEDIIAEIGPLSHMQMPVAVGRRKSSRLWFGDVVEI